MPSLITIVKPSCQYRTRGCSFSRLEARAFTSRRLGCNTNHSIEVLISLPETAASAQHTQRRCSHFEKRNNALTETFREHAYVCLLRTTAIAMMKTGSRFSTDMLKLSAQTGAQRSQPCVQKQQRAHCVRQVTSSLQPHTETCHQSPDWIQSLELDSAKHLASELPPRVLILYGSLRPWSYSKLLAFEFARILDVLGAETRVFDPAGLPLKDFEPDTHRKIVELRSLSQWSEAHVWVCPEQHGTITGAFKNQIDCIPLSLGSVRPTQERVLAVAQVNGGSQSFNVVNQLRTLGRWMRMFTIPNQSSVAKAWAEFDDNGRMKPSAYRSRVVDVAEELYKFTVLLRGHSPFLVDRYSEREEVREKGRLQSQAEKEAAKVPKTDVTAA